LISFVQRLAERLGGDSQVNRAAEVLGLYRELQ